MFLAFAIYGYTTARLEILLLAIALGIAWGLAKAPGWWRALVPVAAGYVVLGVYALLNPGALTGRFGLISIWADGAPLNVVDRSVSRQLRHVLQPELPLSLTATRTRARTRRSAECCSGRWRRC